MTDILCCKSNYPYMCIYVLLGICDLCVCVSLCVFLCVCVCMGYIGHEIRMAAVFVGSSVGVINYACSTVRYHASIQVCSILYIYNKTQL